MKQKCLECSTILVKYQKKFCSTSCSAKRNNRGVRRHGHAPKKCEYCGTSVPAKNKFCSRSCTKQFQYEAYIQKWKLGLVDGLTANGTVTNPVKRYLREKYNNQCCLCKWSEMNPFTRLIPLVADHIDGNWRNNTEENLRLICPNCDSLTATYGGANVGRGRPHRVKSSRVK